MVNDWKKNKKKLLSMLESNQSMTSIASEFNVSRSALYQAMQRMGIPVRSNQKNSKYLKFKIKLFLSRVLDKIRFM